MGTITMIVIGVVVLLILWLVGAYNQLVRLKNRVQNAWSQIDVQLQRRYDLIPNLIETVKGYMKYERDTLENVVKARNTAALAREKLQQEGGPTEGSLKDLVGAETALRSGLASINALAENYPQLRASENMQQLQEELRSTENKVAFSRQSYNDAVMEYNTAQQVFPTVLLSSLFGHHPSDLFDVKEPAARDAVKVSF